VPNLGQPTIGPGATGAVARRLQRALRRTPDLGISIDGVFGPQVEAAVKSFQEGRGILPGSPSPSLKGHRGAIRVNAWPGWVPKLGTSSRTQRPPRFSAG
jgi:peptidoglycan hydrolase-like protein with peptidoglycan-binding domain